MKLLALAPLLLAASSAQAANLYKCESDGHTTYSDRPCDVVSEPGEAGAIESERDSAAQAVRVMPRLHVVRQRHFVEASLSGPADLSDDTPR